MSEGERHVSLGLEEQGLIEQCPAGHLMPLLLSEPACRVHQNVLVLLFPQPGACGSEDGGGKVAVGAIVIPVVATPPSPPLVSLHGCLNEKVYCKVLVPTFWDRRCSGQSGWC